MPKPIAVSEKMMYSTIRLHNTRTRMNATGFLFKYDINGTQVVILVSNRHFVEGVDLDSLDFSKNTQSERITFSVHIEDDSIHNMDETVIWYLHSKEDLAFFIFNPILDKVYNTLSKRIFAITIEKKYIPSQSVLDGLLAIENVVMIGYPNGLYDQTHNLPLMRTGVTSTHPAFDYQGLKHGLVDMACLPGSSGSPIFILNEGMYFEKGKGTTVGSRVYFLGVENSMPVRYSYILEKTVDTSFNPPKIEYKETDKYAVSDDINLGIYIKSSELDEFETLIQQLITPPTT